MQTNDAFYKLFTLFTPVYEGEAPAAEAPAGEAPAGEAPAGDAPAGDAPAEPTSHLLRNTDNYVDPNTQQQQLLIQEQVKAKTVEWEKKYNELQANFEALEKRTSVTQQSRDQVEESLKNKQENLSDLQAQITTIKEAHTREMSELESKYRGELDEATSGLDKWRTSYIETRVDNEVRKAATEHKAVSALVLGKTIRDLIHTEEDESGNLVINMRLLNSDGQMTPMSIGEGVKYIKENTTRSDYNEYQGIFKLDGTGGINKSNADAPGSGQSLADAARQSPEAYRRARDKFLNK